MRLSLTLLLAAALLLPGGAAEGANARCDGQEDSCDCGMNTPCWCCDENFNFGESCGNCVWWAWHEACCHWRRGLPWCTHARTWMDYARDNGYPTGGAPRDSSIFVCAPSGSCSDFGHVGWVVRAFPDGSFDSTEMFCGGPCGVHERHRNAGFATAGFIYNPDGGDPDPPDPPDNDDSDFVAENLPDGSEVEAGSRFRKWWRIRNTGNTTWTRGEDYLWTFDGETRFAGPEQTRLGDGERIAPGQEKQWEIELTAPQEPGRYRGYWKMDRFGVHRFGQRCWVEVVVAPGEEPDSDGDGAPQSQDCDDHDPERAPGRDEVCDGKDNDCDGPADEDLSRPCDRGCGPGEERCEGGQWGSCSAPEPRPEECNGADDDCDGAADEDLVRTCAGVCGDAPEVCEGGQWVCKGGAPGPEVCNGFDDDCDGQTDEGCPPPEPDDPEVPDGGDEDGALGPGEGEGEGGVPVDEDDGGYVTARGRIGCGFCAASSGGAPPVGVLLVLVVLGFRRRR